MPEVTMHVLVEYLDVKPTVAFSEWDSGVQPDAGSSEAPTTNSSSPKLRQHATTKKYIYQHRICNETSAGEFGLRRQRRAGNTILQVASFTLPPTRLGFAPLSFFVMSAAQESVPGLEIYSRPGK